MMSIGMMAVTQMSLEIQALQKRRAVLLERIALAADEIKRIDRRAEEISVHG